MSLVYFTTHPDVAIDPDVPVPRWLLSTRGKERMKQIDVNPIFDHVAFNRIPYISNTLRRSAVIRIRD